MTKHFTAKPTAAFTEVSLPTYRRGAMASRGTLQKGHLSGRHISIVLQVIDEGSESARDRAVRGSTRRSRHCRQGFYL